MFTSDQEIQIAMALDLCAYYVYQTGNRVAPLARDCDFKRESIIFDCDKTTATLRLLYNCKAPSSWEMTLGEQFTSIYWEYGIILSRQFAITTARADLCAMFTPTRVFDLDVDQLVKHSFYLWSKLSVHFNVFIIQAMWERIRLGNMSKLSDRFDVYIIAGLRERMRLGNVSAF
jgi:hypothetical protein